MVRGAGPVPAWPEPLGPGQGLCDPAPVSALPLDAAKGPVASVGFACSRGSSAADEVVFTPGSRFRVLEVRSADDAAPLVLLRELPGTPLPEPRVTAELADADRTALARLRAALDTQASAVGPDYPWPPRCR